MDRRLITLDSSAVIALIGPVDSNHSRAVAALDDRRERLIVPAATLGEVGYFIDRLHPLRTLLAFVDDLTTGAYAVDIGFDDYHRIREFIVRYADLPLGLMDAAVIACAERNGGRVLTYDYRHFGVVAGEGTITLVQ